MLSFAVRRNHARRARVHDAQTFAILCLALSPAPGAAQERDTPLAPGVTPGYTVGKADSGDWEMFGSVPSVAFDDGGRLFILDAGNRRILQVGGNGALVRTIGRAGRGPGELSRPVGLTVTTTQELVVFDAGISAFSVFDTSGRFIRSFRPPFGAWYPGRRLRAHPDGGVLSAAGDGQALVAQGSAEPGGYQLNLSGTNASEPAAVARAWGPGDPDAATRNSARGAQRVGVTALPAFSPGLHFDALPDGRIALVDSTTYEIELWASGQRAGRLTRSIAPRRTSAADRRAEVERRRERAASMHRPGISLGPTGSFDQMLQSLETWPERSVITGLRSGPDGTLWVGRLADETPTPIDVWRGDAYLGTIRHPNLLVPDAAGPGGLVAFIEEVDLGEPIVRVATVNLAARRR